MSVITQDIKQKIDKNKHSYMETPEQLLKKILTQERLMEIFMENRTSPLMGFAIGTVSSLIIWVVVTICYFK